MNENWNNFLIAEGILTDKANIKSLQQSVPEPRSCIFPITHLGVLAVSGSDAQKFLQGQVTCNIDDITETKAGIGAFCSAKGRVISTFFIVKQQQALLLLLPLELMANLQKRLQMYILRADVQLNNKSDELCFLGIQSDSDNNIGLPKQAWQSHIDDGLVFKYPSANHWLWLGTEQQAIAYYQTLIQQGDVLAHTPQTALLQDIYAGIPWLTVETSEQFIPQSINLDKLDGISFKKGCYTGQEIVARTHYLGKSKNIMVRAQLPSSLSPLPGAKLYDQDSDSNQSIGNIVNAQLNGDHYEMLIVVKEGLAQAQNIALQDAPMALTIISCISVPL